MDTQELQALYDCPSELKPPYQETKNSKLLTAGYEFLHHMWDCAKVNMGAPAKMPTNKILKQKTQGGHKFFTRALQALLNLRTM